MKFIFILFVLFIVVFNIRRYYSDFNLQKELLNYLGKLSVQELQYKTQLDSNDKNILIKNYLNKVKPLSNLENLKIKNLTNTIDDKKIFNDTNWNIVKTLGKKIEFGYPYTIGDSILLSENYIHTGDDDSLINSLVHEKIHVNQRKNQELYNRIYKKQFKYIIPTDNQIVFRIDNKITNPDDNNSTWLIKQNGKLYIVPYLHKNGRTIRDDAFLVESQKNKYIVNGSKSIPIKELEYYKFLKNKYGIINVNLAHPNETFVDIFLFLLYSKN